MAIVFLHIILLIFGVINLFRSTPDIVGKISSNSLDLFSLLIKNDHFIKYVIISTSLLWLYGFFDSLYYAIKHSRNKNEVIHYR